MKTFAMKCREILRASTRGFTPPNTGDVDAAYYAFLDREYRREGHRRLRGPGTTDYEPGDPGVFLLSIGLLTYGRIEVVPDILRHSRVPAHNLFFLKLVRTAIPWPDGMDPLADREEAIRWIERQQGKLRFDADAGVFKFVKNN